MITTIFDRFGNLHHASDADAPQQGTCILCHAKMYRRVSELGNPHYALAPGERHSCDACRNLSDSSQNYVLRNTLPKDILDHYFSGSGLPGDPGGPGSPGGTTRGPAGERTCKVVSLAQLCALGYLDCHDQRMANNQWLSSVSINPRFSYMLMGLQQIGKRILQGKPLSASDRAKTIRIRIYIHRNVDGKAINRFKTADLHFADEKTYNKVKNMLFEEIRDDDAQMPKQIRRYDRIAVIADWITIPADECACGWTCDYEGWKCIGHLYAEITHAKCVYPIPHSKVSKKKEASQAP